MPEPADSTDPSRDCPACARLVAFREKHREAEPGWHNAPVASFGTSSARLLIVGLAPGLKGANRTGRPFTGDYAGELLYGSLIEHGVWYERASVGSSPSITPATHATLGTGAFPMRTGQTDAEFRLGDELGLL